MTDAMIGLVALPLAGALATLLLPRSATAVAIGTGLATTVAAGLLLFGVATQGALHYEIGGWSAGLGIALRADGLSALLLMMTALVALAASIYASAYFKHSFRARPLLAIVAVVVDVTECPVAVRRPVQPLRDTRAAGPERSRTGITRGQARRSSRRRCVTCWSACWARCCSWPG